MFLCFNVQTEKIKPEFYHKTNFSFYIRSLWYTVNAPLRDTNI